MNIKWSETGLKLASLFQFRGESVAVHQIFSKVEFLVAIIPVGFLGMWSLFLLLLFWLLWGFFWVFCLGGLFFFCLFVCLVSFSLNFYISSSEFGIKLLCGDLNPARGAR